MFGLLLPIHLPNIFTGIISHQGGLGYDPGFYLDFELLPGDAIRPDILFYTSDIDVHREACEGGYMLFKNIDFNCHIVIAKNEVHGRITTNSQTYIFNFITTLNSKIGSRIFLVEV